jgi:D-alanyl-D-alanine carboxypeptidase
LNQTGLDVNEQMAGAYGSATDMAKLIAVTAEKYPDILEVTRYESVMLKALPKDDRWAENTDKIVEEIPGIIASKTGFTDLAGGNLAVVFDLGINHRVAIAVLGSSREGRFTDVKALLNATLSYYRPE